MKKILLVLLTLCCMTGCQFIQIERKTYHRLNSDSLNGKSFQIIIADGAQRESLEFGYHCNVLASLLKQKGMIESEPNVKADYMVLIDFKISGSDKHGSTSVPHFTTTGGTSSFNATTYGSGGSYNTYGTVSSYPTLQYAGSTTEEYNYTEYTRELIIKIFKVSNYESGDKKPIYETQAYSAGSSRDTTKLVPILIKSLMYEFPLPSGLSDKINVSWDY